MGRYPRRDAAQCWRRPRVRRTIFFQGAVRQLRRTDRRERKRNSALRAARNHRRLDQREQSPPRGRSSRAPRWDQPGWYRLRRLRLVALPQVAVRNLDSSTTAPPLSTSPDQPALPKRTWKSVLDYMLTEDFDLASSRYRGAPDLVTRCLTASTFDITDESEEKSGKTSYNWHSRPMRWTTHEE